MVHEQSHDESAGPGSAGSLEEQLAIMMTPPRKVPSLSQAYQPPALPPPPISKHLHITQQGQTAPSSPRYLLMKDGGLGADRRLEREGEMEREREGPLPLPVSPGPRWKGPWALIGAQEIPQKSI